MVGEAALASEAAPMVAASAGLSEGYLLRELVGDTGGYREEEMEEDSGSELRSSRAARWKWSRRKSGRGRGEGGTTSSPRKSPAPRSSRARRNFSAVEEATPSEASMTFSTRPENWLRGEQSHTPSQWQPVRW